MTVETLASGDIELEGRFLAASNATFSGRIGTQAVVYKPIAGERPLWDFPDGTLASREVAAFALSRALGWDIVPRTWIREGPFGPGMVQLWREPDPEQEAITIVPAEQDTPPGWCHVFEGIDAQDQPVALIHEDSPALRRMAVFDILANNADRKGGHVLAMTGGHRHGVDHGLTFHTEPKLRTVLWGWAGAALGADELEGLRRVGQALDNDLGGTLTELLSGDEITSLAVRCEDLLRSARFPAPSHQAPAIPWPPF